MKPSLMHDVRALSVSYRLIEAGARPSLVASILRCFNSTEVERIARAYARAIGKGLPKGPMATEDGTPAWVSASRRARMSAALSQYRRAVAHGLPEEEALWVSYASLERMSMGGDDSSDFVIGFERFYAATRGLAESRLKLATCGSCNCEFVVCESPLLPRDCPFCGLSRRHAPVKKPISGRGRLQNAAGCSSNAAIQLQGEVSSDSRTLCRQCD